MLNKIKIKIRIQSHGCFEGNIFKIRIPSRLINLTARTKDLIAKTNDQHFQQNYDVTLADANRTKSNVGYFDVKRCGKC